MSKLDDIRAAIVAKVNTVPGIGQVHNYERYAKQASAFISLYESSGRVLGWNVRRVRKTQVGPTFGHVEVANEWEIKGFMALNDVSSSEISFDNLVESIGDAFLGDITLGGVVDSLAKEDGTQGIQVLESAPVMFNGVLCHMAKLQLFTLHYQ